MSLNCTELDCVIKEIPMPLIIRSFSQSTQNDLYMYLTHPSGSITLYFSILDGATGLFIVPEKHKINGTQKNLKLGSMLNSRLKGSRILSINQENKSRIICFEIKHYENTYKLFARLWGTASNILLTDNDNCVIETARRYPARGEWPKEIFNIPESKSDKVFTVRDGLSSINDDLFYHYFNLQKNKEFNLKFDKLEKKLTDDLDSCKKRINACLEKINSESYIIYKNYGDLIQSSISMIKIGSVNYSITDEDNAIINIPLNPKLTAAQNADKYYGDYKRIKGGIESWKEQYSLNVEKEKVINSKIIDLNNAKNIDDLIKIEQKVQKNIVEKIQTKKLPGRKILLSDGFVAYISRSSREADELLKYTAKGNDYWFHIRDNTGSHVIVKVNKNREITDSARLEAAMLALHFSKSKNEMEGDIYFTRVKYLHKPNLNTPGLVFPTQEKNIKVKKIQKTIDILLSGIE